MSLLDIKSLNKKIEIYFKLWIHEYLQDSLSEIENVKFKIQDEKTELMLEKDIIQNKIDIAKCDKEEGDPVSDRYFYSLKKALSHKKYELTNIQSKQMKLKRKEDRIKKYLREGSNEKIIDVLAEELRDLKGRDYVGSLIKETRENLTNVD